MVQEIKRHSMQCRAKVKRYKCLSKKDCISYFHKEKFSVFSGVRTTMTAHVIFPSATFIRSTRAMKTNIWHLNSPPGINLFDRISPEMSRVCEYISSRCLSAQTRWFDIQKCKIGFKSVNVSELIHISRSQNSLRECYNLFNLRV